MYLKRLELKGFKSFPNKTDIEFKKGITSIVGPNGSGKSNILDSIRWVLGEQSIKNLRGEKLEDVIFTGSENKAGMNYCEVCITLDNSNNEIGLDFSEINIKRRAYKSGESEFFLNNKLCRLKDIKELLLDTGIGKDSYSIIEQGKVDEILSNNPQNRRKVFDEACKISKFRYKKQESEKNLKATKDNLERINYIYIEIENQINPLKAQMEKAKEFLKLSKELKEIEINKYIYDIEILENKINILKEELKEINEQLEFESLNIEKVKESKNTLENELINLEKELKNKNKLLNDLSLSLSKKENIVNITEEKIKNIILETDRIKLEILSLNERKNSIKSEIEFLKTDETSNSEKITYLEKSKTTISLNIKEYKSSLDIILDEIENLKDDSINLLDDKQVITSKISALNTNIENINNRKENIDYEISDLNSKKQNLIEQRSNLNKDIQNLKIDLEKINSNKLDLEIEINNINSLIEQNNNEILDLKYSLNSSTSKLKIYNDMENHYEGFRKGVKETLKNKSLIGIYGAVGQLITVEEKYEKAVESALGSYMQNIITKDEKSAKEAIYYLKKNNLGRVTFLPLDIIKPNIINKYNISSNIEFKILSEVVKCDIMYKNIIENILGRTILIDDLELAIEFANKNNHKYKLVTLDGEILNPGGALTGGSFKNNTSILSRKRILNDLEEEIKNINSNINNIDKLRLNNIKTIKDLKSNLEKLNLEIKNKERIILTNEYNLKNLDENYINLNDDFSKLEKEKKSLGNNFDYVYSQKTTLKNKLNQINIDYENNKLKIERLNKKYKDILNEYEKEKKCLEEVNLELVKENQIKENNLKDIDKLVKEINYIENKLNQNNNLLKNNNKNIIEFEETKKIVTLEIDDLKKEHLNVSNDSKKIIFEIDNKKESVYKKDKDMNVLNRKFFQIKEDLFKVESKIEKYKINLDLYIKELFDKYELTFLDAKLLKKENFEFDKKRLENIKRQIKTLGNINLDSIKEYEELKERYDFYSEQKLDLEESIKSIEKLIIDLEKNMRSEFILNFNKINEQFKTVYKKIFSGGYGELVLVDKENILESDIEIIANPPGKKTKNLSLLSGGEKALTAISILFSIILTRETPFCVLDEIEAPLDDANIYRFGEFLKSLSTKTQFISITHRRGTMEASDFIYGVTMKEKGISTIISLSIKDAEDIVDII